MNKNEASVRFVAASSEDGDELASIRVETMRPSLEAAGRFDPVRARDRFQSSFEPENTRKIVRNDETIGVFVVKIFDDHLYVLNSGQGEGIGVAVINHVKEQANTQSLLIRLCALIGSEANSFYQHHGFNLMRVGEFDNYYEFNAN